MVCDLQIWLNHFEYHAQHPHRIPRGLSDRLSAAERQLIARSIATFQLGEQSEGLALLRAAERFAASCATPSLVRIVALLIREEQRHAALLRGFMVDHQIALKSGDWTDAAFRRVRRLAGLELCMYVLITAELIGIVYYRALGAVTGCQRLKVLCRTLVADELAHVGFESHLLLTRRAARSVPVRLLLRLAHRAFFAVTVSVVWVTHRRVLRRCGYNASTFLGACLKQYAFYLEPLSAALTTPSLP